MYKMHIPIKSSACVRIRKQATRVGPLHSCKQAFDFLVPQNFATLDAYLATPGNQCFVEVDDNDNILPYTTLMWAVGVTPVADSSQTAYQGQLWLTAADTTRTLAGDRLVSQLIHWRNLMVSWGFPNFREMEFVNTAGTITFYMPWGMIGAAVVDADGPDGEEAVTLRNDGVDNPLFAGLWGPQRILAPVVPFYPTPYYGPPPIG